MRRVGQHLYCFYTRGPILLVIRGHWTSHRAFSSNASGSPCIVTFLSGHAPQTYVWLSRFCVSSSHWLPLNRPTFSIYSCTTCWDAAVFFVVQSRSSLFFKSQLQNMSRSSQTNGPRVRFDASVMYYKLKTRLNKPIPVAHSSP